MPVRPIRRGSLFPTILNYACVVISQPWRKRIVSPDLSKINFPRPSSSIKIRTQTCPNDPTLSFHNDANNYCTSIQGTLAHIGSRDTWWTLGMLIYQRRGQGLEAFYINKESDFRATAIHVARHGRSIRHENTAVIANIMDNMNAVPPQFDVTLGLDVLAFFCELPAGRTETTTEAPTTTPLDDLQINDGSEYEKEIIAIFGTETTPEENIDTEEIEIDLDEEDLTEFLPDIDDLDDDEDMEPDNVSEEILNFVEEQYDFDEAFDDDEYMD